MEDYGRLIYLDIPKTGSRFVAAFLRQALHDPLVISIEHARVQNRHRPGVYYLASCRHPLAQYESLYRYGCDGHGLIAENLRATGLGQHYTGTPEGFERWLEVLFDPANATALGTRYAACAGSGLGLMSYRYLYQALQYPLRALRPLCSVDEVIACHDAHTLVSGIVRTESLSADLWRLATVIRPDLFEQSRARAFLDAAPRINRSHAQRIDTTQIAPSLMQELRARERLLLERFYPDDA